MDVRYFKTRADFRKWMERNHAKVNELNVGFYKKGTGSASITYREALDEALCFGWIDGVRRTVDGERYAQRFTPRRTGSVWSLVNINRVKELEKQGLMHAAGLKAFEGRDVARARKHSEERGNLPFDAAAEKRFKANKGAWAFFAAQPAGYRKIATWWVMSGKKPETRARRLQALIEDSASGRRARGFPDPGKRTAQRT